MYIIPSSRDKINILAQMIVNGATLEEIRKYITRMYEANGSDRINRIFKNGRTCTFVNNSGEIVSGHVRKNGRNKTKTITLSEGISVIISLFRLRSDDAHTCQEVFLNIFLPYCHLLLECVAKIIFHKITPGMTSGDEYFSYDCIHQVLKRWERWKPAISHLGTLPDSEETFLVLSEKCLESLHIHVFQTHGHSMMI